MTTLANSITVNVPLNRAYNQWTQFEECPVFMDGVKEVKQLDAKRLHWKAKIGRKIKEWDAEIFEQVPDQRIAWRSTGGAKNSGSVSFIPLAGDQTKVNVQMQYHPEGMVEAFGDVIGMVEARVSGDLKRFKAFIEKRPNDTRGWRGEMHDQDVQETQSAR